MSDASKSDPTDHAPVTPVASEAAPAEVVEPAPTGAVAVAPAAEAPVVVAPDPVARPKRAVGAWSFVLGLLTGLGDIAFVVFAIVTLVGAVSALSGGDLSALGAALGGAGLALVALFLFFGGFLTSGLAVLLGFIALISGRGRVLGVFGLLFGLGALAVRIALLSAGFNPDLS